MISKIFHISDIHIRLYQRHKEYEQVFERLFNYIEKNKDENSVIFLGGDIVHSKTEISTELVYLTSKFLKDCADILPTILIAGNHDANLKNSHRLDILTPITFYLNHPNLYYWRNSGEYEFNGVSFSVFSVFDNNWVPAKDLKGKYKIALYHGPIWESKTDTVTIESNTKIDIFNGFDLALLGDIHVHQYLNESKTIGYSSSLIQQNYGESLDGHGLIVWDLKSKKSKFVPIKNDHGFYTFYLVDGKCDIPENLPKNLRCRIIYENSSPEQIERFVKSISQKYKIGELLRHKFIPKNSPIQNSIIGNSRDVSYQNKVITDYLFSTTDITTDEIEEVLSLNNETNQKLPILQKLNRNIIWKPLKLEFSNMFSYGENNSIDFTQFNGVYGIGGLNAVGKSSLLEVICFVIYDKSTRAFKASHILNTEKDSFYCRLFFELNGQKYGIERIGSKKLDGNVKVDVNFWTYDGDDEILLNGEDRDKTNYSIREYLGTYDDFVMTALSSQYDNQNFVDKSQRDRKELLYKFLDIYIYDELYKIAKEESKSFQVLIREFEKEDLHNKSSQLYQSIEESEISLNQIESELNKIQIELTSSNNQLISLNKNYIPVEGNLNIEEIERGIESTSIELTQCVIDVKDIDSEIFDMNSTIEIERSNLSEYSGVSDRKDEYHDIEKKIIQSEKDLQKIHSELHRCTEQKNHLLKHEYDPNCQYCVNNEFVKNAKKLIDRIPELEQSATDESEHLNFLRDQLEILKPEILRFELKIQIERRIHELLSKLSNLNERKNMLLFKGKAIKEQLKDFQRKNKQYIEQRNTIEKNNSIIDQISLAKKKISELEKTIELTREKHRIKFGEISTKRKEYEECNLKLDNYLKYIKKYRIYELYLQALSKDGVPYKILETILPVIESEVNVILNQLSNFTVKLESTNEKYIHGFINYGSESSWPIELSSGMERFILSIAFRCSLSEITSLPKANFLAIDEGFGVLDSENIQQVHKLFSYLKKQYDYLLIISHIDSMKDAVDKQIFIEKIDGFSKIHL